MQNICQGNIRLHNETHCGFVEAKVKHIGFPLSLFMCTLGHRLTALPLSHKYTILHVFRKQNITFDKVYTSADSKATDVSSINSILVCRALQTLNIKECLKKITLEAFNWRRFKSKLFCEEVHRSETGRRMFNMPHMAVYFEKIAQLHDNLKFYVG